MRVNGHVASLENLYRMSVLRPEGTRRHVERWIVELLRAAEGTPDLDGIVRRIVRADSCRWWCLRIRIRNQLSVTQPLVGGLVVAYGIDNDRTISHVTKKRLDKWNVEIDDLHETAMGNLTKKSQAVAAHAAQDDDGRMELILFQTMDGYDASRVLLPDLHDRLREHLGSPFAAGDSQSGHPAVLPK